MLFFILVNDENEECPKVLRVLEKIDDEAAEFGIQMVKMNDRLMAKKYGFRNPPGLVYFRKGKYIKYEGICLRILKDLESVTRNAM